MKKLKNLKAPSNANNYAQKISDIIYNSALNTIGYRNYLSGYKPWWNENLNSLKKLTKKLHRKLEKIMIKNPDFYKTIKN